MSTSPPYRWIITHDRIAENEEESDKGTFGPRGADASLKSNPSRFTMKDGDGTVYYQGMIYGDYSGFEPLDDFGMPNAGCSEIWINGEVL